MCTWVRMSSTCRRPGMRRRGFTLELIPAGAHAGRHDLHESFHGMDLAAEYFELLPHDQRVVGSIGIRLAEIHPKERDAEFFIYRDDASGDERMLHDLLRLDIFAAWARTPGS